MAYPKEEDLVPREMSLSEVDLSSPVYKILFEVGDYGPDFVFVCRVAYFQGNEIVVTDNGGKEHRVKADKDGRTTFFFPKEFTR